MVPIGRRWPCAEGWWKSTNIYSRGPSIGSFVLSFSDSGSLKFIGTKNMSELTFRVYTEIITLELIFLALFLTFVLFGFDAYVSSLLVRMFLHIASYLQLK